MRIHVLRTGATMAAVVGLVTASGLPGVKAAPRQLVLQVHSVQCKDETTGKWREKGGVDTIAFGGISIGPAADIKPFDTWHVGVFKKDGVVKKSSPPHALVTVPFNPKMPFPQNFQFILVLAELDPGKGFEKQLAKIAAAGNKAAIDKLKSNFQLTKDAVVKQAQSGKAQTFEAHLVDIGQEMLRVKSEEWMQDDLFPPIHKKLRVTGPNFRFANGKLESPIETLIFTGERIMGKYAVQYSWRLM
jgi:hypothetical protein